MADLNQMLQQLESCAQILMVSPRTYRADRCLTNKMLNPVSLQAPPNLVSPQQLNDAQQVFIDFQKTKEPFEICRQILENVSCSAYVKFQVATCLKNGVIRDWNYLKAENRKLQLLTYLFEYVNSRESLEPFVREQLLLVSAIILKRIGIDEGAELQHHTRLADRDQSLNPVPPPPSVVASTLNSLLQILTSANADGSVTTPSELHKKFTSVSFLLGKTLFRDYRT